MKLCSAFFYKSIPPALDFPLRLPPNKALASLLFLFFLAKLNEFYLFGDVEIKLSITILHCIKREQGVKSEL